MKIIKYKQNTDRNKADKRYKNKWNHVKCLIKTAVQTFNN